MVIQVERFLSVQKCTRLCWSLTDHELVLAEESKELGTRRRKGTSNNDWKNAGIWSCLAMFVQYPVISRWCFPTVPWSPVSLAELRGSLCCTPLQMCPAVPTWHLPRVVVISQGLSAPLFLGFTPCCCLSCLSGTETETAAPWAGEGRAGTLWQNLEAVFSPEWCQHVFGLNFSLNSASKSTQAAECKLLGVGAIIHCAFTHQGTRRMPYL